MKPEKVLITGGLGFIGLRLAKLLLQEGMAVRLMDNLSSQVHGEVPDLSAEPVLQDRNVEVFRGDVCESTSWPAALSGVGAVVHLAADTGTAQSMYEISRYVRTNVDGTAALMDYLANHRHNVTRIVLASSRAVYGEGAYDCGRCGIVYPPMRSEAMLMRGRWDPACPACSGELNAIATPENSATTPASIYGATKLAQENVVRIAGRALGIPTVIYRFQNVYGEGQSLKNPYTGLLSIYSNQLRIGHALSVYEDGKESRDFVHVEDAARAVLLGLVSDRGDDLTLNVGSGRPTTIGQIALLLTQRFGSSQRPVVSGQYRAGDIRHGFADLTLIGKHLGFVPEISIENGLDRLVDWVNTQALEADCMDLVNRELVRRALMPEAVNAKSTVA